MGWARDFYEQQDEWAGVATGELADNGRARAATISRLAGPGRKRVLELGAGGGQAAAATADLGHHVVAIELVPHLAEHAAGLARQQRRGSLTVLCGDFYEIDPGAAFDVVTYWDGFGIGEDTDQRRLLRRIRSWLTPDGCALIDVYTPWYWAHAAGREMRFGEITRRYEFDADGCRMLDRWWRSGDERLSVTQSLRCYAPADLRLLLAGTGLALATLEPGGSYDEATKRYTPRAPLGEAMTYLAQLVPAAE